MNNSKFQRDFGLANVDAKVEIVKTAYRKIQDKGFDTLNYLDQLLNEHPTWTDGHRQAFFKRILKVRVIAQKSYGFDLLNPECELNRDELIEDIREQLHIAIEFIETAIGDSSRWKSEIQNKIFNNLLEIQELSINLVFQIRGLEETYETDLPDYFELHPKSAVIDFI